VLLLLGLLVQRTVLLTMWPLGLLLAIVLPLARLLAVWLLLPSARFSRADRLVVAGCGLRGAVPLTAQLLALMVVVVLSDLLLQTVVMRRQLAAIAQR
jgi:NhaP-type Na+/H+ and K+/H+ antiporter